MGLTASLLLTPTVALVFAIAFSTRQVLAN
jgi:hypothetical protein